MENNGKKAEEIDNTMKESVPAVKSGIMNELFGLNKPTDIEKLRSREATYAPAETADPMPAVRIGPSGALTVADKHELAQRLTRSYGMKLGTHTMRSLAGNAIKTFPIIVSDDIDPNTLVMLKNTFEEEYAAYIQLLVSNEVVDVTTLNPNDKTRNMAIQALDRLDGTDFGTERIAHKMQSTGNLTADDMAQNIPIMSVLRGMQVDVTHEHMIAAHPELTALFEDAIIVPASGTEKAVSEIMNFREDFSYDNNTGYFITQMEMIASKMKSGSALTEDDYTALASVGPSILTCLADASEPFSSADAGAIHTMFDPSTGYISTYASYSDYNAFIESTPVAMTINKMIGGIIQRLNGPARHSVSATASKKDLSSNVILNNVTPNSAGGKFDSNVSAVLARPENHALADKFDKAGFLLASNRIAGTEYLAYLNHIGVPVENHTALQIIQKFPTTSVIFDGIDYGDASSRRAADRMRASIDRNKSYIYNSVYKPILGWDWNGAAIITGSSLAGAAAGVGAGLGIGAATGAAAGSMMAPGIGTAVGLGVGLLGGLLANYIRNRRNKLKARVSGWERVETLIDLMEKNRYLTTVRDNDPTFTMKALDKYGNLSDSGDYQKLEKDMGDRYSDFQREADGIIRSVAANHKSTSYSVDRNGRVVTESYANPYSRADQPATKLLEPLVLTEDEAAHISQYIDEACIEIMTNPLIGDETKQSLTEAKKLFQLSVKTPGEFLPKVVTYKTNDVTAALVPGFATSGLNVYGSVEYDHRDMADRKYNQPLILTVSFKDRLADDSHTNSDLTAVIGIMGVITRIPSAEMAKLLTANAKGSTLKNFFGADASTNNATDFVSDILAGVKGSAELLPTSGKIWRNLSKVSDLAAANALAGDNDGNITNAHIVFSQKEIDLVKHDTGIDYLKDPKKSAELMERYSAFELSVCNDSLQIVYNYSDPDSISWDAVPYSAYMGKSDSAQLTTALSRISRGMQI